MEALNPIQALAAEGRKAQALPIKIGSLSVKRANQWVEESLTRPDPRFFCNGLIVENENIVLFAVSNAGKSIFATQLAEEIAAEEPVLYIDCELSDKQFQLRYTDTELGIRHVFPENFLRAEIDPEDIDGSDMDKAILSSVEEAAKFGIRKIFIDNITFIARDSEKASAASEFMKRLVKLKKTLGLTIIVLAHTPKVHGYQVMSQYSLAGSAQLINFFDSAIAIGLSAENKNYRYVKQVKYRAGEKHYDASNVQVYEIVKENGRTFFDFIKPSTEAQQIGETNGDALEVPEDVKQIADLHAKGKTLRAIAEELNVSLGLVQRRLKKAEKMGYKPVSNVSDVSAVSDTENEEEQMKKNPIHQSSKNYGIRLQISTLQGQGVPFDLPFLQPASLLQSLRR